MLHHSRFFIVLAVTLMLAGWAFSQDSLNVSLEGMIYNYWTNPMDIFPLGNRLYLVDQVTGLTIIDISDPESPAILGNLPILEAQIKINVWAEGNYAYVTTWSSGLYIIDVSNPTEPFIISHLLFGGLWADDIIVENGLAYIGLKDVEFNLTDGIYIVDVSQPATPVVIGECITVNHPVVLAKSGNYIYASCTYYYQDINIIDVSNPQNPIIVSAIVMNAWEIAFSGDYALVCSEEDGLSIINISNPAAPFLAVLFDTIDYAGDVSVDGDYVYVVGDSPASEIYVIDFSNPLNPQLINTTNYPCSVNNLISQGNYLYITIYQKETACIYNISNPIRPDFTSEIGNPGRVRDAEKYGDYLFTAGYSQGLRIVDVSVPSQPREAASYDECDDISGIEIIGNYAYTIGDVIRIFDISDTLDPVLAGTFPFQGGYDMQISGGYMYITNRNSLYAFDISNPSQPRLAGSYPCQYSLQRLDVTGNYAYLVVNNRGMMILDISSPVNIFYVGGFHNSHINDIVVEGNYAYIGSYEPNIIIVDISNPSQPVLFSSYDFDDVQIIEKSGNYLFGALADHRLAIFDISNPALPALTGLHDNFGFTYRNLCIDGDYVYFADENYLEIFDCSEAITPSPGISGGENNAISLKPSEISLSLSPNPFNPQTTVEFTLPEAGDVSLKVFDTLGREVQALESGGWGLGKHTVVWDAGDLPSGIYFIRLESGGEVRTVKGLLVI